MSYTHKDFSGSLFKNERKASEKHADYTGSGLVDGKEYYLDLWINTAADGKKRLSLKLKPKQGAANGTSGF
jgi:hypothetical protein